MYVVSMYKCNIKIKKTKSTVHNWVLNLKGVVRKFDMDMKAKVCLQNTVVASTTATERQLPGQAFKCACHQWVL